MIFKDISAVYSENYIKHIHKLIRKMLRLTVKAGVSHKHIVTTHCLVKE
jgi:hypothetical protein